MAFCKEINKISLSIQQKLKRGISKVERQQRFSKTNENVSLELGAREPENSQSNPIKKGTNNQESSFIQETENVKMVEIFDK